MKKLFILGIIVFAMNSVADEKSKTAFKLEGKEITLPVQEAREPQTVPHDENYEDLRATEKYVKQTSELDSEKTHKRMDRIK